MIDAPAPIVATPPGPVPGVPGATPSPDFALLMARLPGVQCAAPQTSEAPPLVVQPSASPTAASPEAPAAASRDGETDAPTPTAQDDSQSVSASIEPFHMLAVLAENVAPVIASPVATEQPPHAPKLLEIKAASQTALAMVALPEPSQTTAAKTTPLIGLDAPLDQPAISTLPANAGGQFPAAERFAAPPAVVPASFPPAVASSDWNTAQTLARDLSAIAAGPTARFDLRAEALGPLAVTITRGDDGNTLRLGVESTVAAQHIRSAEPQLADLSGRTGAPFVQVSVDLSHREQRHRGPARMLGRSEAAMTTSITTPATPGGRFA